MDSSGAHWRHVHAQFTENSSVRPLCVMTDCCFWFLFVPKNGSKAVNSAETEQKSQKKSGVRTSISLKSYSRADTIFN